MSANSLRRRCANSALGYGLDPTFGQIEPVGEIEQRHQLWGQPRQDQDYRFSHTWTDGNVRKRPRVFRSVPA